MAERLFPEYKTAVGKGNSIRLCEALIDHKFVLAVLQSLFDSSKFFFFICLSELRVIGHSLLKNYLTAAFNLRWMKTKSFLLLYSSTPTVTGSRTKVIVQVHCALKIEHIATDRISELGNLLKRYRLSLDNMISLLGIPSRS